MRMLILKNSWRSQRIRCNFLFNKLGNMKQKQQENSKRRRKPWKLVRTDFVSHSFTKARDSKSKYPSGSVTIAFSDVQQSTFQWEKFPELMSQAIEVHNHVLRE